MNITSDMRILSGVTEMDGNTCEDAIFYLKSLIRENDERNLLPNPSWLSSLDLEYSATINNGGWGNKWVYNRVRSAFLVEILLTYQGQYQLLFRGQLVKTNPTRGNILDLLDMVK